MNIEKHKGNINKAKGVNNPLPIILSSRADLANMSRGQTSSRRAPAWRQACSWKLGDIFGEQTRTATHIFIINSSRLQLPCKMGQCFLAKALQQRWLFLARREQLSHEPTSSVRNMVGPTQVWFDKFTQKISASKQQQQNPAKSLAAAEAKGIALKRKDLF